MKCLVKIVVAVFISFAMLSTAQADWEIYDDFSSGSIDTEKWDIDDSSAVISVENGQAKFMHQLSNPNDSAWLKFNHNQQNIIGIRADVRVQSWTGDDVKARLGGYFGKIDDDYVWIGMQARPHRGRLEYFASLDTGSPNYNYLLDLIFGTFHENHQNLLDITGTTFVLEMLYDDQKITFKTDSQGEYVFQPPESFTATDDAFKGIGTRSYTDASSCVVYFDNVYVYRK